MSIINVKKSSCMQIKIKYIILTQKFNWLEMTRGCRMHATTTTHITAAIAGGVAIADSRNSTMQ